jgi:hypothetical protein
MSHLAQSSLSPQKLASKFNERFPIGTTVRYWTGVRGQGLGKISKTRTEAQVIGGHTAVVWLEDQTGCVALSHVEPQP